MCWHSSNVPKLKPYQYLRVGFFFFLITHLTAVMKVETKQNMYYAPRMILHMSWDLQLHFYTWISAGVRRMESGIRQSCKFLFYFIFLHSIQTADSQPQLRSHLWKYWVLFGYSAVWTEHAGAGHMTSTQYEFSRVLPAALSHAWYNSVVCTI